MLKCNPPPTEEAVTEGSWSNSTDIDKEKKWYKEFLARVSKNNSESDEEVKARISALKTCVARMEKCLDDFKKYKKGKGPLRGIPLRIMLNGHSNILYRQVFSTDWQNIQKLELENLS